MNINFDHASSRAAGGHRRYNGGRKQGQGPRVAGLTARGIHRKIGEGPALKRGSMWAVALAGLLVSCATLKAPFESSGEERLDLALEALGRGDYRTAHEGLSWVAQKYPQEKVEKGQCV